ncbi:hypothetical protein O6P43_011035 [Quillaja saponaria]|uniref:Uncharacterized protein n=1 Tax=Quillaja saponaria TaxID=32244 RepID=A0AAD7Q1X2_QUISA|nr:hypothetical protein O6P43_011035 [Quillaja saponaria]
MASTTPPSVWNKTPCNGCCRVLSMVYVSWPQELNQFGTLSELLKHNQFASLCRSGTYTAGKRLYHCKFSTYWPSKLAILRRLQSG